MGENKNLSQKGNTKDISKVDKLWKLALKKHRTQKQQKKMTSSRSESPEKKKEEDQVTNINDV